VSVERRDDVVRSEEAIGLDCEVFGQKKISREAAECACGTAKEETKIMLLKLRGSNIMLRDNMLIFA
jgi:hypothetical protein